MRNNGYIKLDRKILKWGWYDDANTFRLFVHLLLTANYVDSEYRGRVIKRGQLAVGRNQLSNQLNISVQAVRTALNHLISTNEITIETNPQGSIITIKNYDKYQKPTNKSTDNQPTTNQQLTNGATNKSTTSKEYIRNNKKDKNIKKGMSIRTRETDTHDKTDFNFQDVVDLYNTICVSLKKVKAVTPSMKDNIANVQKRFVGIDFKAVFEQVEKSDFLTGRKSGWRGCNLTWILNPNNTAKILNGDYDDFDKKEEVRNASYSLADFESKSLFTD